VDALPADDAEFTAGGDGPRLTAAPAGPAVARMDLLTVLDRQLDLLLGTGDGEPATALEAGQRWLVGPEGPWDGDTSDDESD
jgi:hypothetical protein